MRASKLKAYAGSMPSIKFQEYTLLDDIKLVLHFARTWMQYGIIGFAGFCAVMGAVQCVLVGN